MLLLEPIRQRSIFVLRLFYPGQEIGTQIELRISDKRLSIQIGMVLARFIRFSCSLCAAVRGLWRVNPDPDENRLTSRNRLKAAASRRGLSLTFLRTTGQTMRFKVDTGGIRPGRSKYAGSATIRTSLHQLCRH